MLNVNLLLHIQRSSLWAMEQTIDTIDRWETTDRVVDGNWCGGGGDWRRVRECFS